MFRKAIWTTLEQLKLFIRVQPESKFDVFFSENHTFMIGATFSVNKNFKIGRIGARSTFSQLTKVNPLILSFIWCCENKLYWVNLYYVMTVLKWTILYGSYLYIINFSRLLTFPCFDHWNPLPVHYILESNLVFGLLRLEIDLYNLNQYRQMFLNKMVVC